ncbi:type II secretion system protein [Vibrio gallicus]|uniref:type II secretion system protein n=1 Tax=Vibrio gallicus TaxID=190897 RepID=UPI0021C3D6AF|nr:type II secretion system protein [Vibrio gallicus]
MKKQHGFTLIELIVVIVILGVLAVTAAPKFLNLQSDARKSALQGLKGAMSSASRIVYSKSVINNVERNPDDIVSDIATHYGYPAASGTGIGFAVAGLSDDWTSSSWPGGSPRSYLTTFKNRELTNVFKIEATHCYVEYQEATSSLEPVITVHDSEC